MSKTIKSSGNITLSANNTVFVEQNLTVAGNLTVSGTNTTVNTTNTDIKDRVITLNKGEVGPGVSSPNAYSGLDIDRGTSPHVGLRWNEALTRWELTTDGSVWQAITTSSGSGSYLTKVQDDPSPKLGGNIDLYYHNIYGTGNIGIVGNVGLTGNVVLDQGAATEVVVYADTVGAGGTGVYFNNPATTGELISKKKAIVYSIIF